jgi:hypothetical protein
MKHVHLTQFPDDLLGLVTLSRHLWSSSFPNIGLEHFDGGGSLLQIPRKTFINLGHHLDPRAVNRDQLAPEQFKFTAKIHRFAVQIRASAQVFSMT